MSYWYYKEVGDGVAAFGPSMKVHELFIQLASKGSDMSKVAVFSEYDHERNIVTLYFTPEAQLLAEGFLASPCEKPMPGKGFGLLVGEMGVWDHFPDKK
jgi:hypothetical protein